MRSKCRTYWSDEVKKDAKDVDPNQLSAWNYDGSSTGQAPGNDSEVTIKPRAVFRDPFRGGRNKIVMCDTHIPPQLKGNTAVKETEERPHPGNPDETGTPDPKNGGNTREPCRQVMDDPTVKKERPMFGIEQEYTLFEASTKWPLGWPRNGYPGPQGPYYCGSGTGVAIGRDIAEAHYRACLYAGITMSGINGEVMPGQWEFQVGPCVGIDIGDHLWMARYLLIRICELYNVDVSFDPKPIPGDWNGAGCHTNYSTETTRTAPGGYKEMQRHFERLSKKHNEHQLEYDMTGGESNKRRLTGNHETSSFDQFSQGVANRGSSIRVPRDVPEKDEGYYEDRRPSSDCDPYVVARKLVETTLLDQ